jgi:4-amino-4-deoxy-L-arabinose transferase-like glycosyltransferase
MRRITILTAVAVSVAATTAIAMRDGDRGAAVDRLAWLAGCWAYTSPRITIEEHWTRPAGGSMLGMSRTLRRTPAGDSTMAWEFVRIYPRGTDLVYAAQPHNQPAAEFVSENIGEGEATFANPAHDYPQRIIYRRAGTDSLKARVEGLSGGRMRGSDYPYARIACDQPPA